MRIRNVLAVACLSGAVACSGGAQDGTKPQFDVPKASPVPVTHPLTGVVFAGSQDWQRRPVLAVKVDNSPRARPQAGLDAADVVYEELAEGGVTRFIALFNSSPAPLIGPVRSARSVDPQILAPFTPLFGFSGAVPQVLSLVKAQRAITDVSIDKVTAAYERIAGRQAPHNLYTSTASLWKGRDGAPPRTALFPFRPESSGASGGAATAVSGAPAAAAGSGESPATSIGFALGTEKTTYSFDAASNTYIRAHGAALHLVEGGKRVAPSNIVMQYVTVRSGAIKDANGQFSPETIVVGEGEAIVIRGGAAVRGRWVRSGDGITTYLDGADQPILFERGQTWVELLPKGKTTSIS